MAGFWKAIWVPAQLGVRGGCVAPIMTAFGYPWWGGGVSSKTVFGWTRCRGIAVGAAILGVTG